ncbi:hypothetical protein T484DRAFT_1835481 [Baffinella frigidus]|nr:hypothetical protein T484DRAFT_1835481 [Cryptophyta sp. CCMP2293]
MPAVTERGLVEALADCSSLPSLHALCAPGVYSSRIGGTLCARPGVEDFSHQLVVLALQALDLLTPGLLEGVGRERLLADDLLARAGEVAGGFDASSISFLLKCAGSLRVVLTQEFLNVVLAKVLDLAADFSGQEATRVIRALEELNILPSGDLLRVLHAVGGVPSPAVTERGLVAALAACASLPALHALCARSGVNSSRIGEFSHELAVLALHALDRLTGFAGLLEGDGREKQLADGLLARGGEVAVAGGFDASSVSFLLKCAGSLRVVPPAPALNVVLAKVLELAAGFSGEEATRVIRALEELKVEPSGDLLRATDTSARLGGVSDSNPGEYDVSGEGSALQELHTMEGPLLQLSGEKEALSPASSNLPPPPSHLPPASASLPQPPSPPLPAGHTEEAFQEAFAETLAAVLSVEENVEAPQT